MASSSQQNIPHVVIVGAGFGGLRAARELGKAPVRVTVVDRNNYHLFQPLLYQVATAGLSPTDIAHPVRDILRSQKNLDFRMAEVRSIDLAGKRLLTSDGDIGYDYLVLAVGGESNSFGMDSIAQNAFGMKDIDDATAIRNHLLKMFELANEEPDVEKRKAMLTFVIAGGGPTGVELSGAISELTRLVLDRDYPRLKREEVQILLVEMFDRLLPAFPEELSQHTLKVLHRKGIEVRFHTQVTGYDGAQITFKDGESIPTQTVIWAAGVKASSVLSTLGLPQGSLGRVAAESTLQLKEAPNVFLIGDCALLYDSDGKPLPMVSPVAIQQGVVAAANIQALLNGLAPVPFQYKDPGILATIGRNQAVARLWGMSFRGFLAWLLWLFVHLIRLIGFRNKLLVFINWMWDYIFYDRSVRMIGPCL